MKISFPPLYRQTFSVPIQKVVGDEHYFTETYKLKRYVHIVAASFDDETTACNIDETVPATRSTIFSNFISVVVEISVIYN